MPHLWTRIGFALGMSAVFVVGCGGDRDKRGEGAPPSEGPAGVDVVYHAELKTVEGKVQEALQGVGAPGGAPTTGGTPSFTEVFAGAGRLAKGADEILRDTPATLTDEERLRYEGLVAQLKQKAADLQAAAEQQQAQQARRAFLKLTASCVQCHEQFGAKQQGGGQPMPQGDGQ